MTFERGPPDVDGGGPEEPVHLDDGLAVAELRCLLERELEVLDDPEQVVARGGRVAGLTEERAVGQAQVEVVGRELHGVLEPRLGAVQLPVFGQHLREVQGQHGVAQCVARADAQGLDRAGKITLLP